MFKVIQGKVKNMLLPVTPSTVIAKGALVALDSGYLIAATSSTPAHEINGILVKAIAATDDDYADDRMVEVIVPMEKNVVVEFSAAALDATDPGTLADLTDAVTVNQEASTHDVVKITEYISATKGRGILMIGG